MKFLTYCSLILGLGGLSVKAQQANAQAAAELVAKLITTPTQVGRLALLNDTDFVFNFGAGVGVTKGAGGTVTTANVADFPAVVGNGMAMAVGVMEPCGMNTPHTHPRATEFLYVINGTALEVGFIEENGARFVSNTVSPGQATIFPKGSVHFQQNLGCDTLTFVAALNNIDPGVLSAAQRFFGLSPDVVAASLGDLGIEEVAELALGIPDNMALGVQSCLDRCEIKRGTQPMAQLQPRVSGNALPSGVSSSYSPSQSKRAEALHVVRKSVESGDDVNKRVPASSASNSFAATIDEANMEELIKLLRLLVGVMIVGYLVIGVNWFIRCRKAKVNVALDAPAPNSIYRDDIIKA